MDNALFNSTFALTVNTQFIGAVDPLLPVFGNLNVRQPLDTAAGVYLHNLSLPSNTNGILTFPHFKVRDTIGSSNLTISSVAYGVDSQCREIPETEYVKKVERPSETTISIRIDSNDRLCNITSALNVRVDPWSPEIFMSSWYTACDAEAGWSRSSVLSARYNKATETVENFTLLSCKPTYFSTFGMLLEKSEPNMAPRLVRFTENSGAREELSYRNVSAMRYYLEQQIHNLRYFNPGQKVDGNEFVTDIYMLSQVSSDEDPLAPGALLNATETLFETVFAVFSSMYLFHDLDAPVNKSGTYVLSEKRLFVVPVVAYIILAVLGMNVVLNVFLFAASKDESMLKEEPYSLMSYAGLLHRSEINTALMSDILDKDGDPGRARETGKRIFKMDEVKWLYNKDAGRITFKGSLAMQTLNQASTQNTSAAGRHLLDESRMRAMNLFEIVKVGLQRVAETGQSFYENSMITLNTLWVRMRDG